MFPQLDYGAAIAKGKNVGSGGTPSPGQKTGGAGSAYFTASWEVEDILSGYSLRADGYACKTASFSKFVNALGHLGLEGLLADEPSPAKVKALRTAHQEFSGEEPSEPIHLGMND